MNKSKIEASIKAFLSSVFNETFAEATLEDGTVIITETEAFEEGAMLYILDTNGEKVDAPDGEYKIEGSTLTVSGSVITKVTADEVEEEIEAEATIETEVKASEETVKEEVVAETEEVVDEVKETEEEIDESKSIEAITEVLERTAELLATLQTQYKELKDEMKTSNEAFSSKLETFENTPASKPITNTNTNNDNTSDGSTSSMLDKYKKQYQSLAKIKLDRV